MMPNMGGLDPRRIQSMMKQMGISNDEIEATKVIIKTPSKDIIIENPKVMKIKMQGEESFQISGDISESKELVIPDEDINMVAENTNISTKEAKEILIKTNGDIAKAISLVKEE